jgi:hypothetical protein
MEENKNQNKKLCPRCKTLNPVNAFRCKNENCLDILPQGNDISNNVPHDLFLEKEEKAKDIHMSNVNSISNNLSIRQLMRNIVRKTDRGTLKELIKLLSILAFGGLAVALIADKIPRSYRQSSPLLLIFLFPILRKILISPKMETWFKEMYVVLAPHMGGLDKAKPVDVFVKVFIILLGLTSGIGVIIYILWLLLAHKL